MKKLLCGMLAILMVGALTAAPKNKKNNKTQEQKAPEPAQVLWTDAPSLKEAYKDYFDYIGFACTFKNELNSIDVPEGLAHQADCITMGNEMKPDFLFNWQNWATTEDFVAEDGNTYQVPFGAPNFSTLNIILKICKLYDLKLRGHVLVWHSQTPEWFFMKDYQKTTDGTLADKATMTAREEWYIKTVIEYVNEWEKKNNKGQHIVITWDVVNEACADNATDSKWLRQDSNWYKIFQDDTFIVNAFRYANKYAPEDVLLCYNDYNCYQPNKTKAICKVINAIQAAPDARIDVVGMQSHVKMDYPRVTGPSSFETAIKTFVDKGLDVQITELDIANGSSAYYPGLLKMKYNEYFKTFIANRKTEDKHGICGVTIWGLTDNTTWLNDMAQYKGTTQYPLLFNADFTCKPAFDGVIEATKLQ